MAILNKLFLSMGSAIFWLLAFGTASGIATFIESNYNTQTAWALVYGAWWFALIQLILGLNLAFNIYKYKMLNLKKLPALIFHFSFLMILLGAAMTRYLGFEGQMHIRENESSNEILSAQSYIQLKSLDENDAKIDFKALPLYVSSTGQNSFDLSVKAQENGEKASLSYADFIPNAMPVWRQSDNNETGEPILEIMFSNESNSRLVRLNSGESIEVGEISFTFNDTPKNKDFISISLENGEFFITTNQKITALKMADMSKTELPLNQKVKFESLRLYTFDGINFAPKTMLSHAVLSAKKASENNGGSDAIIARLEFKEKSILVPLFYGSDPQIFSLNGAKFELAWSPVRLKLPFALHLDKFELARYPGSNSPMSYKSYATLLDSNTSKKVEIYMNNVLDHRGYRFFQSSYDMDERGTILSVNNDPGKLPTYFGYFLLGLGLFLNILNPNSRFRKLAKKVNEANSSNLKANSALNSSANSSPNLKNKSNLSNLSGVKSLALIAIFLSIFTQINLKAADLKYPKIDENFARQTADLIIQSSDGRMKPFDTLSKEILNKLYRSDKFDGLDANSVMISMMVHSSFWRTVPIIKIKDDDLREILGLEKSQILASFNDFFGVDSDGNMEYKLLKFSELSARKSPATRNNFDKEVIKADEKLNILYMVFMGELFRVLPKIDDENHTWYSPAAALMQFNGDEKTAVLRLLTRFFTSIEDASLSGAWSQAENALNELKAYQAKFGEAVMPSEKKVKFEILFNKINIFSNLMPVYLIAGFLLLGVVFLRMLSSNLRLNLIFKIVYGVNILAFLIHSCGLALRWYIAQHAPWSDGYESMVFIAWCLAFSGMIFSRNSAISLALTSVLAGVTLFVAHLSWMDPQITNLVPVLQSYWLTIHVSVITASYGFLGLCSLLGAFTLILFALQRKGENAELSRNILEATRINEMAMILGLSMLVFGNFLGGVWANESWGRYWGWDSKETWALVSILVYAAILHARFIPAFNSQLIFAVLSMFGYSSIIMTYFGVNFYLTGMHSYAAGDAIPVPDFVWVGLIIMVILSLLAARNRKFSKTL